MSETPITAAISRAETAHVPVIGAVVNSTSELVRKFTARLDKVGRWFTDVAQKFGALLADLLSPAVFAVYSISAWNLASSLGWVDNFFIASGPLSNWIVWAGLAIVLNIATSILRRHFYFETSRERHVVGAAHETAELAQTVSLSE